MTDVGSPQKQRGWLAKAITVLISLVIALVFAEVALRILVRPKTKHAIWPPGASHVFRPAHALYPDTQPETRFTSNKVGLRGPDYGKDGEELRVLAIGGSTTECLFQDDLKTWPAQLSGVLGSQIGKHVWVGNAGRSGLNTGDHVLHAKYLLAEQPHMDAVLVFAGVNDVNVALSKSEEYAPIPEDLPRERYYKLIGRAFHQIPGRLEDADDYETLHFYSGSQVYQLWRRIKRSRNPDLGTYYLSPDDTGSEIEMWREKRRKAPRLVDELPDLTAALATFKTNLLTIEGIVRRHGSRLYLLTQPVMWRANMPPSEERMLWMGGVGNFQRDPNPDFYSPRVLAEAMRMFNDVTKEVCKERDVTCIDLVPLMPPSAAIFYDDCHFGESGSRKIADAVAATLAKEKPFSGP